MRISFECKSIDDLLNGGVEGGILTAIYGEGGCGKTNLCLQLARNAVKNGKTAIYIDTEGVSIERLKQICGKDFDTISKKILFYKPYSLSEQDIAIDKAIQIIDDMGNVGLVILDSGNLFYRATLGSEQEMESMRFFSQQIIKLLTVARKKNIPIVVTSQVYTDIDSGEFEPIGGQTLKHNAKTIIRIEKIGKNKRRAILVKHRSISEGVYADFMLTGNGVESVKYPKIFGK